MDSALLRASLDSETDATLTTTGSKDGTTGRGLHPGTESVGTSALEIARLVGALHVNSIGGEWTEVVDTSNPPLATVPTIGFRL